MTAFNWQCESWAGRLQDGYSTLFAPGICLDLAAFLASIAPTRLRKIGKVLLVISLIRRRGGSSWQPPTRLPFLHSPK